MRKRSEYGFSIVEAVIVVLVLLLIAGGCYVVFSKQNRDSALNASQRPDDNTALSAKPQLQNWPVKIEDLNSSTRLAGDVYMDDQVLINDATDLAEQPVMEFGRARLGTQTVNSSIDFLTRANAPVYSVSNGYVLSVERKQTQGRDDYEVRISLTKTKASQWLIVYKYVTSVSVAKGDAIAAGDRIGTAAPYGSGQPFSMVGLQITYKAEPRCPTGLIASGAEGRMKEQFLLLTKAWESQSVNGGAYNEPAWTRLGCMADKVKP